MSSRLHSKFHRHNHHTLSIYDPRYPDASHDPIASPESPFLGNFILNGTLSAIPFQSGDKGIVSWGGIDIYGPLSVTGSTTIGGATTVGGTLGVGSNITGGGNLTIPGSISSGSINANGSLTLTGPITAANITLTNAVTAVYTNNEALTATGEFLILRIQGQRRAIRLWKEI